ncbi:MAG: hypothetical protein ACOXZK_05005 [Bacteroidales bacterium]|jgi:hypothetical protein|nr:hypothetical protein [Bacteroidales bacterium]
MKFIYIRFLIVVFLFNSLLCFSQEKKFSKYGINFIYPLDVKKSNREQLFDYVSLIKFYHNGKVPLCPNKVDTIGGVCCKDLPNLPDTIIRKLTLEKIIKWPKPYAHKLLKRRTKEVQVYRLRFVDEKEEYYEIFSIDNKLKNEAKLTVGDTYELLLLPYFGKDISQVVQGKYVFLLIDNVWISQIYMKNINIYTSPYINGLYYTPKKTISNLE